MTPRYRLVLTKAQDVDPATRRCELDVLARWYGDTAEQLEAAYGPYEDQSGFLSVTRDDGHVVGVCRLITPGQHRLKTLSDIEAPPWQVDPTRAMRAADVDPSRAWDIATLAVRRELGAAGQVVAAALYYGLIHGTRVNAAPWVVAIIDRRARSLLSMLGLPLHAIPGTSPQHYMGSTACAPVYCHVPTVVAHQRATDPEAHRLVSNGYGLAEIDLPDDSALMLQARDVEGPGPVIDLRTSEVRQGGD